MGQERRSTQELTAEVQALQARVRELEGLYQAAPEPGGRPPLQLLLENSPDSITVMDPDGHLLYLNRTINPRTIDEVLGRSAFEFLAKEQQAAFREAFDRALKSGHVQHVEVSTENGMVWETRLVPLMREGKAFAVMGIGADVTSRKLAEQALVESQKLEAVGRLTAGIAHNFNNMLMVVLTNIRLCQARVSDGLRPRLDDAEHAAGRAADMVRELMVFARKKPAKTERAPGSLAEIAARAVSICRTTCDPEIDLRIEVDGSIAPVRVDASRIEQALVNIILNARDALRAQHAPRPEVRICMDMADIPGSHGRLAQPAVRLRVCDNGPGMSETVRGHIFEPFFTTKDINQGTGLGLATVYGTMVDHEGLVSCESRPGAGATFTLLFPVHESG
jgi:two-component system cell cycle sensor histidine kinase/response regulator CckA